MTDSTAPQVSSAPTSYSTAKVAVVTGATGGMGRHIIADLARDHLVYAVGRRDVAQLPNVVGVHLDLVEALDALAAGEDLPAGWRQLASLERVDVLVHAAARAEKLSVAQASVGQWREQMDLNVHAPAMLTQALLPGLRKAEGTVIFINSGAGRHSYADNTVYAATKHALYAVADGLRLAELGIRVATVAPGPTDTPMLAGLQDYDSAHVIAPIEVARAVRAVVDAGPTVQLTEVQVRPRVELHLRS
ncbi:SDR family oxidoreductase [Corynebacterium lizhenjunii]|uniref:SDR family oxidoreductase n=1 Tax=Corynebacterium lizhenjunii TaxID=2709394 RepID=A0A7T0KE74_9CORY|nr:SDR family oxidoreductase [Corynebacterium lizhenjunii]QPK78686.1 SDR family oxidoreductase [Corynebacterium lizhenjunii]